MVTVWLHRRCQWYRMRYRQSRGKLHVCADGPLLFADRKAWAMEPGAVIRLGGLSLRAMAPCFFQPKKDYYDEGSSIATSATEGTA